MATCVTFSFADMPIWPNLRLEVFEFLGPHLSPARGGYSSLALLQPGVIEKVERKPNFLLVVTEVDISSQFLRPHNDPLNIMYRFEELDELAGMRALTDAQVAQMERSLPAELVTEWRSRQRGGLCCGG